MNIFVKKFKKEHTMGQMSCNKGAEDAHMSPYVVITLSPLDNTGYENFGIHQSFKHPERMMELIEGTMRTLGHDAVVELVEPILVT